MPNGEAGSPGRASQSQPRGDGTNPEFHWPEGIPWGTVRGRVLDRSGRPISGAEVWLDAGVTLLTDRTATLGRFELRGIQVGWYDLYAAAELPIPAWYGLKEPTQSFRTTERILVPTHGSVVEVDLVIDPEALALLALETEPPIDGGAVLIPAPGVDGEDDDPLRGVLPFHRELFRPNVVNGTGVFRELAPGSYKVLVHEVGSDARYFGELEVELEPGRNERTVQLQQMGRITGQVTGGDGSAARAGVTTFYRTRLPGRDGVFHPWWSSDARSTTTDAAGRFSISPLPPGSWEVVVVPEDGRHARTRLGLRLPPGGHEQLLVELPESRSVRVRANIDPEREYHFTLLGPPGSRLSRQGEMLEVSGLGADDWAVILAGQSVFDMLEDEPRKVGRLDLPPDRDTLVLEVGPPGSVSLTVAGTSEKSPLTLEYVMDVPRSLDQEGPTDSWERGIPFVDHEWLEDGGRLGPLELPPGRWRARLSDGRERTFELRPGEHRQLQIGSAR